VGTPARRPAAVAAAPPGWTTARQTGKTAAKFTAPTNLDVLEMGDHLNGRSADVQLVSTRSVLACAMRSRSCGVSG
jgi:hypothetical protein